MRVIDNVSTLWVDDLRGEIRAGDVVRVAAATFSLYAFEALRDELESVEEFQFLFTSPAFEKGSSSQRRVFNVDHRDPAESSLYGTEFELRLRNELTQRHIARECANWVRRKASFRASNAPRQQPAAMISDRMGYVGFTDFTTVDLGLSPSAGYSQLITTLDADSVPQFLQRFEALWEDSELSRDITEEIAAQIGRVFAENPPQFLYYVVLYSVFAEFLTEVFTDALPNEHTGYRDSAVWKALYDFQADAATGLINKLERFNGCILADSVGLGKTFTALAVIKYYEERNDRVLVLAPKKLCDNWLTFRQNRRSNPLAEDRFRFDVLAHTDLQRDRGESMGQALRDFNWGNYDLVVIDESHNFRNAIHHEDRETRYDALLRKVIREGVATKVLMLSATPVNNRFLDLRNQLNLAVDGIEEQVAAQMNLGTTLDEVFRRAQTAFNDWSKRPAEDRSTTALLRMLDMDFFTVLDAVTIARSRKQVTEFYDTSAIGSFPTRMPPRSERPALTTLEDVPGFEQIADRLADLTLATYTPLSYVHPSRLAAYEQEYGNAGAGQNSRKGDISNLGAHSREQGIKRLMTTNLLKRLESSVEAFRRTLQNVLDQVQSDLAALNASQPLTGEAVDWENLDEDAQDDLTVPTHVGRTVKIRLDDLDDVSFRADLEADELILTRLLEDLAGIDADRDAKLRALMSVIDEKIASPLNNGNRKVLVFTAFADTAEYLYDNVAPALQRGGLHTALVTGGASAARSTLGQGIDFADALTLFSPRSKRRDVLMPGDTREVDVLIATDCISEGQNLQDCDMVVNYDIHWNPVRIVQRFGRVDRIGSTNERIQLVNFWPDVDLDQYIRLVERVESRMRITNLAATGDDNLLDPAESHEAAFRRQQLERLQHEIVDLEDTRSGVSITDLGLNDFHMDLQSHCRDDDSVATAPRGLHTVVPAAPEKGLVPGVIFALRWVKADDATSGRNQLHPHYLVYLDEGGEVVVPHTNPRRVLELLRMACRAHADPIPAVFEPFNIQTADGARMGNYSRLLSTAIASITEAEERSVMDSLFMPGLTAAPPQARADLDAVELTAFVAIRSADD